jgi:ribosomal protein S18 acetylase RimI-like enzyme
VTGVAIRNYRSADAPRLAHIQARCVTACPDTGRFPPEFWEGPSFENGQNIFCAVDQQDGLLGYAAISPSYISRHLDARVLWLDLRADPRRADAGAIKDVLFERALARAHEIAGQCPEERAALSATYFAEGQASIEYLRGKGFARCQSCYTLRRDLAEPIPDLPAPPGVQVQPWRMETESEQRAYLEAYDAAFGDEGKNLEDLQHFMKSEHWSVGTTFTAFAAPQDAGNRVVGSVAIWYQPGSRLAGKTEAVFVIPEWRRRGIARYLLREGMLYLKARGLAYAELEMDSANTAAMALYESLGYRVYKGEVSLGLPLWVQPDRTG